MNFSSPIKGKNVLMVTFRWREDDKNCWICKTPPLTFLYRINLRKDILTFTLQLDKIKGGNVLLVNFRGEEGVKKTFESITTTYLDYPYTSNRSQYGNIFYPSLFTPPPPDRTWVLIDIFSSSSHLSSALDKEIRKD